MTCKACGYDEQKAEADLYFAKTMKGFKWAIERCEAFYQSFIELAIVERGPFFVGTPDVWPDGINTPAIKRGTPVKLYACPKCGTVKMEV